MFRLLAKNPIHTVTMDLGTNNITTSAWKQLVSSLPKACTGIEIFNPSGSTIQIATGGSGSEVALPYTITPGGSSIFIPIEISGGKRISAKAVDVSATTTGQFTINFFG